MLSVSCALYLLNQCHTETIVMILTNYTFQMELIGALSWGVGANPYNVDATCSTGAPESSPGVKREAMVGGDSSVPRDFRELFHPGLRHSRTQRSVRVSFTSTVWSSHQHEGC